MTRIRPHRDLTGLVFSHLTVLGLAGRDRRNNLTWRCQCDCGLPERIVVGSALVHGNTKSCGGCKRGVQDEKHGRTGTPEYGKWNDMVQRCTNPNHASYSDYGGRGIGVCERWRKSFIAFMEDMGERESPHLEIERVNNEGSYEPGNCIWENRLGQLRNTRRNHVVEHEGRAMCGSELAELATDPRILSTHVCKRLRGGWSVEDAIGTPLGQRYKLTDEDAQRIYDRAASGEGVPTIAADYDLTKTHVYAILSGRSRSGIDRSRPIIKRVTLSIAQEIFDRLEAGAKLREVGDRFGISISAASFIKLGRSWPDVDRSPNRRTRIWYGMPVPAPGIPRHRPNRICT